MKKVNELRTMGRTLLRRVVDVALGRGTSSKGLRSCRYGLRFVGSIRLWYRSEDDSTFGYCRRVYAQLAKMGVMSEQESVPGSPPLPSIEQGPERNAFGKPKGLVK